MKLASRILVSALCLILLLSIGLLPAAAEETVAHDFLSSTTIKDESLHGETIGRITQEGRDLETGKGSGAFTALPKTSMDSGGRVIAYISSTTYNSSMLLAYDIEIVTYGEDESTAFSLCTWGENVFSDGTSRINLAEEMCAVAGVEPLYEENDDGILTARLPGGHYKGVIDVSEAIPEGFNQFSHLAFYWKGKTLTVNKFAFVTGTEASPTIVPTTTTTEAPTTTTEAPTTTTAGSDDETAPTATVADGTDVEKDGLPTGAIIAIAVAVVIVIGGGVGIVLILRKKK